MRGFPDRESRPAPPRGPSWRLAVWCVGALALAACTQPDQASDPSSSRFELDTSISGVVLENVTACEVDADCFLRIEFADTSVAVLYGTGERPAPACTIAVEVSDAAFPLQPGERVDVVVSRCAGEGYYLRRLVRMGG